MTKRIISILTFLPMMLFLVGCSEIETGGNNPSKQISMTAFMPKTENITRVGLSQASGSLDLIASWQKDDELLVYLLQDNEKFDVGKIPISDISSDGKTATFSFTLPNGVKAGKSIKVYAFCSVDGDVEKGSGNRWDVFCNTDLTRNELNKFKAPLYGEAELDNKSAGTIKFRHFNTYEFLHVKNTSNTEISFRHFGFNTDKPWYSARAGITFKNDGDKVNFPSEWDGDYESETVSIPVGNTINIISCYLPSGYKMKDAYLVANINGSMVTSVNKKSSDINIETGHAYHMYATWDGTSLTFDNGDASIITVEPNPIEFGSVAAGTTVTGTFTVSNTGNDDLNFTIESLHSFFDIPESGKSFTLKHDESMPFTITFTPKEGEKDKPYSDIMTITSNALNGTVRVPLTGKSESREEERLNQVIPEDLRDKFDDYIPIYDGSNPPNIEGQFLISPMEMTYDSDGGWEVGHIFNDTYIKFHNQDMINNTLDYMEKEGSSESTGTGCFISGEGDNFSVFFNTESVSRYSYIIYTKEALVISGTKTNNGIKDLYYAFIIVDKSDDPNHKIMDVGDFRSFKDGDGMSYPSLWANYSKKRITAKNNNLPSKLELKGKNKSLRTN